MSIEVVYVLLFLMIVASVLVGATIWGLLEDYYSRKKLKWKKEKREEKEERQVITAFQSQ